MYDKYTVEVTKGSDTVLRYEGFADNISDALYKALNQREEEVRSSCECVQCTPIEEPK